MAQKTVELKANERVFVGLSKQNMLFHQCIFELVDNAIAAARPDERINVNVALEAIPNEDDYFNLYVSDNGIGMDIDILAESLQLGHIPTSNSRLNEHGFGLKNALATLSGGNGEWSLWTKGKNSENVLRVDGPFAPTMVIDDDITNQFPDKVFVNQATRTLLKTKVKKSYAQTVQGRGAKAKELVRFRTYLVEHLGVAYRGFLSPNLETNEAKAGIKIYVGDEPVVVTPINVPIAKSETKYFDIALGGKTYKLAYNFGLLDDVKRDTLVKGEKTKYYYQGNMATQGIDIRLGDRVIATRQLETIWRVADGKQLSRDNHFNSFVGELLIPELPRGILSTVNNKTDFNLDDPGWMDIFDRLNEEEYRPVQHGRSLGEAQLRDKWANTLKSTDPNDDIITERNVWGAGAKIDVYRKKKDPDNSVIIYELKVGSASPLNLYQLKMYWDGLIFEGEQPDEGVLLVEDYSDNIKDMIKKMNTLPPPPLADGTAGKPYNFTVRRHKEVGLENNNR